MASDNSFAAAAGTHPQAALRPRRRRSLESEPQPATDGQPEKKQPVFTWSHPSGSGPH